MSDPLRVLLVEDVEDDARLLLRSLRGGGFEPDWERVEDAARFRAALAGGDWDVILADYALPQFSGLAALEILRAAELDIPFIVVSGTIGEEIAIGAMKAGAADYIMKDGLARLVPSIRRELAEARVRAEKRRGEEALRESVGRWSTTFDAILDSICLLDPEGRILQCNKSHAALLNLPREGMIGRPCFDLVHGGSDFHESCPFLRMRESRAHEEAEVFEKDRWFLVAVDPILGEDGSVRGAVHIMSDITARKAAEEKVRASLLEKEVLLREIHHRVKNNMQVMISLLSLQSRTIKDAAVVELLKESQNRIRTMAIVHEKLYRSADLSRIDFSDYIESLAVHLFHVFAVDSRRVRLTRDTQEVRLDVVNAVPCGLILNELISNSLKHAFPGDRPGEVTVALRRLPDGRIFLSVRDDGIGLPEGLDFRKTETLGLQLVSLLAGQLDAEIELVRSEGTEFRFLFPELKYKIQI